MSNKLLWSAINISEGENLESLENLASRLRESPCHLADWSADPDHNRSVFSLVGNPSQLAAAIDLIFRWAQEHIDVRIHRGEHPRMGAVDVVPFVPLLPNGPSDFALHCAERVAQTIAEKYGLPVFFYRDSSPKRQLTLPKLRRIPADKLQEMMGSGELTPDFGPPRLHPQLGVTVMGARGVLTAYNCMTDTKDLSKGKEIVKEIRGSNGGPEGLQALAFPLESKGSYVQISMNLTRPDKTPPHLAFRAVEQACAKRGLRVTSSELIGMVPLEALRSAYQDFLKMETFHIGQVAEWNAIGRDLS